MCKMISFALSGLLALLVDSVHALSATDHCSSNSVTIADREYCSSVSRLVIGAIGTSGTYSRITGMSESQFSCTSEEVDFSGAMAPFDDDISLHLRGPIQVAAFAVFVPSNGALAKREARVSTVVEVVTVTDEVVIATVLNGPASTFTTELGGARPIISGLASTSTTEVTSTELGSPPTRISESPSFSNVLLSGLLSVTEAPLTKAGPSPTPSTFSTVYTSSSKPAQTGSSNYAWNQIASYSASSQTAEGLVFLNNKGGDGSGVADSIYGPSLSYAAADSLSGSADPTIWNGYLGSSTEIAIFSNVSCTSETCGYWRPGAVAYRKTLGSTYQYTNIK
jgi:hypothetical protein